MAILTSHTLNAVDGTHAAGVAVALYSVLPSDKRTRVFATVTDEGGRLRETIDAAAIGPDTVFELVFAVGAYFDSSGQQPGGLKPIREIVIRLQMSDPEAGYHVPLILAPNGYSVWWSN